MVLRQPFVAHCPVEAFVVSTCCGLPGSMYSNRMPHDFSQASIAALMSCGRLSQRMTLGVSRHIDLHEHANHAQRRQGEVDLNARCLAVEVINNVEQPE